MSDNHLTEFEFKSTGVKVYIKPVSPMLLNEARKSIPRPRPPMQEIESADGTKRQEPNPSHPSYAEAMREYNECLGTLSQRVMIRRGVVLALTDEQRAELASLRADMAQDGIRLDDDDKVAYVLNLAVGTPEDITDLVQAITQRGQPTDPKLTSG